MENDKPIQFCDPSNYPGWDKMVLNSSDSTFFHSAAWTQVLQTTYGYKPVHLCQPRGSSFSTLFSLMEVDSRWTGRRGISLPFTDECPPLFSKEVDGDAVFQKILEHGRQRNWKYCEGRGGGSAFKKATPSISFYRHTLNLEKKPEELFAGFDSAIRRAIRKAEKSGVKVEKLQTLEAIRTFYALHEKTRQKHGLPPQPFAFFQSIHKHVVSQNLGFVLIARFENIPIAGAVFFHFGKRAIYKFGASDEKFLHLRGNNLTMWEAMRWFSENGFAEFSMGRTEMANEGLREFKLNWGTKEERLDYWRFDFATNNFVTTPDKVHGWHNHIFQAMPRFAARWAGALLYRHIA